MKNVHELFAKVGSKIFANTKFSLKSSKRFYNIQPKLQNLVKITKFSQNYKI